MAHKCFACEIWLSQRRHAENESARLREALEIAVTQLVSFAESKDDGNAEGYYGNLANETLDEIGKVICAQQTQESDHG